MADFYKMVLRLEAENDRLHKSLEQSTSKINKFEKSSGSALKSVKAQFAKIGPALAGAVTVGGLAALTRNSLNAADNLQKLGQRLGVSTEALSQYQHVADLTGVSFNTLTTAWQRSSRRIAEAARGTGEARAALAELGLEAGKLNQLAPDRQFEILADAIQKVENPADRVRIAMKLFDSEGVALLQTMQGGSEAIRRMREEADALGLTLKQDTADAAARANDAMTRLGASSDALGVVLVDALAPAIETVATFLQNNIPSAVQVASDAFNFLEREILETTRGISLVMSGVFDFLATPVIGEPNDAVTRWLRDTAKDLDDVAESAAKAADNFDQAIGSSETKKSALQTGITFNEIFNAKLAAAVPKTKNGKPGKSSASGRTGIKSLVSGGDENAHVKIFEDLKREADALTERMRTPWEAAADELDRYDELLEQNLITQDTWARAVNQAVDGASGGIEKLADETENTSEAWRDLGLTFSSAFEDAVVNGGKLSDVLKGLEQDILRILTRELVTKPLADAITGAFAGSGSGGDSSGGIGAWFSSFFGGGKAMGGPVAAGIPYLVGERGPELFVPPVRGNILPNGRSAGGNTVNVTINGGGPERRASQDRLATRVGRVVDRAMKRDT